MPSSSHHNPQFLSQHLVSKITLPFSSPVSFQNLCPIKGPDNRIEQVRFFFREFTMFTNDLRQAQRTGKYGTPRQQHLQQLVTQFQTTHSNELKEKITANLANFAYDPYNYTFLRDLNVLELFIDCLSEPNERLIEFGIAGTCNAIVDPNNAAIIDDCGGVPAIIGCLSSPVRNTVRYAIASLYYLCESGRCDMKEILKDEVVELIRRYAECGDGGFGNLARVLLDKYVEVGENVD